VKWYYEKNGEQQGPVDEPTIRGLLDDKTINAATKVWHKGLGKWKPAGEVLLESASEEENKSDKEEAPNVASAPQANATDLAETKKANSEKWYYEKDGKQVGPIKKQEILMLLSSNQIPKSTKVWRKGLKTWKPASEVFDDLRSTKAESATGPEAISDTKEESQTASTKEESQTASTKEESQAESTKEESQAESAPQEKVPENRPRLDTIATLSNPEPPPVQPTPSANHLTGAMQSFSNQMGQPMNPHMAQPMNPHMGQPMNPHIGQPMNPHMGHLGGQPIKPKGFPVTAVVIGVCSFFFILLGVFLIPKMVGNLTANISDFSDQLEEATYQDDYETPKYSTKTNSGSLATKNSSTHTDLGKRCSYESDCASKNCTNGRCQSTTVGSPCTYEDDCDTKNCTNKQCQSKTIGSPCTHEDDCNTKNCTNKRCQAKTVGSPCTHEDDCDTKNCTKKRCRAKTYGSLCQFDDDCNSNNCKRNRCRTRPMQRRSKRPRANRGINTWGSGKQ